MLKRANVPVEISVRDGGYEIPAEAETGRFSGPGYCRDYHDTHGLSWDDARAAIELERELLSQHAAHDGEFEPDEDYVIAEAETLGPFDLGVASVVIALSAMGCVPYSSCNCGLVGGGHQ